MTMDITEHYLPLHAEIGRHLGEDDYSEAMRLRNHIAVLERIISDLREQLVKTQAGWKPLTERIYRLERELDKTDPEPEAIID